MKIISFSLWGQNPKYTIGAIKNADLALQLYPDWICRFYCANTVPWEIINNLKNKSNTQIVTFEESGNWKFTVNRFLPMSEDIEYMISRDTDSRISFREVQAVKAWIDSGKSAHIMRDHPYHGGFPMLAGMFGIKGGIIKNVEALLKLMNVEEQYNYDQIFLGKYIYPFIQDNILIHDEFFENKSFPTKRENLEFVGEVFDENDNNVTQHTEALRKAVFK